MACYLVDLPDGGTGTICGKLGPHCARCRRLGEFLCDYPLGNGRTCDLPMCRAHSHSIAAGVDYCERHHQEWLRGRKRPPVTLVDPANPEWLAMPAFGPQQGELF